MRARLRAVAGWSASQRALRLVVVLGPVVALLAAGAAGDAPPAWFVLVVAVVGLLHAALPESGAGTLAALAVLAWWSLVPDALHPAVLVGSAGLLAAHVAAHVTASAPPEARVDAGVLRLWALRGAAVLVAAPVLWGLARVLRDDPAPSGLWPAGLLAVLLAVAAAALAFPRGTGADG